MTLVNALILMGVTAAIVCVEKSLCLSQLEVSEVINCMLFLYVNLMYKLLNAISIYSKQFDSLLNNSFFFRVKPVREVERRSRRKLGLAPEFKALDLSVRTRRPRVLVQAPQPVPVIQTPLSVPVEPMTPEVGGYNCDQTSCFIAYSCSFSRCRR